MTRLTLLLLWRHCSPASRQEVPVERQGEGRGWGCYVKNQDETTDCHITNDGAIRQSLWRSWALSTSGSEAGGGSSAMTWRRGSGLAMASDRGWGRGGETFLSYCRWSACHGVLTLHSVFPVTTSLGGKSGLLVRRIIRNDAVSPRARFRQKFVRLWSKYI